MSILWFLAMFMSSEVSRYEADEVSCMECEDPKVWDVSFEVYIEYVSISNSLAVDMIRVAISPLEILSVCIFIGTGCSMVCAHRFATRRRFIGLGCERGIEGGNNRNAYIASSAL